MAESNIDIHILATELVKRVNDENRRTRLVEQKLDRVEADLNHVENTVRNQDKEMKEKLDKVAAGLKAINDSLTAIESAIMRMEKEISKRATKAEIRELESYMELISPVTTKFVTKEEMERAIDDKLFRKY